MLLRLHRGGPGDPRPARRRQPVLAALLAACLAVAGAAVYLYFRPTYYTPASIGQVPVTVAPAVAGGKDLNTGPAVRTKAVSSAATEPAPPARPTAFSLKALGIRAPVVPEGVITKVTNPLDGAVGSLKIPDDPKVLGWWKGGTPPGAAAGTVVIAGHVDTYQSGAGALFHLASARPGESIVLKTTAGRLTYRIVARHTYLKARLPRSVWSRTGRPLLAVITCGGPFDWSTHHYADNVVVYAVPVS